mmetsp:Transcript_71906/g.188445  ORF Transcript_71906/g.188445 Transcript_71906/m.188445 type:complete len:255 (-) Transcript_71906:33-797(-)
MAQEGLEAGERAIILAQAAECAERYDDMAQYMKERIEAGGQLHAMERDLLSAAYKGALQQRRSAVRTLSALERHEASQGHEAEASLAADYASRVLTELLGICQTATTLVEGLLLKAEVGEPKAFYLKMQADYYRYTTEFAQSKDVREEAAKAAATAYETAMQECTHHLLTTHPVRLAVALNMSVFQHEVLEDVNAAIATAEVALGNTMQDLEGMPEATFAEVAPTLEMLRDNLSLWLESRPAGVSPRRRSVTQL